MRGVISTARKVGTEMRYSCCKSCRYQSRSLYSSDIKVNFDAPLACMPMPG